MKHFTLVFISILFLMAGCKDSPSTDNQTKRDIPFIWENANLYFLLTDRFNNGDPANDVNFQRTEETAVLRGFEGGDLKGITQKIKDGYFTDLGINAIWFSPVVEQVHGAVDEGTGNTYGFHGYWAKDWTALEPNFGSEADLAELVETAHAHGIRIVLDVVINHTGPVTDKDPVWSDEWVRTEPTCQYTDYESTVTCTLVDNLPDVKTESVQEVDIPKVLAEKWAAEGRLEQEMNELNAFFDATGYPRTPRFYFIKWLTDFIRQYGIDGYRIDTAKHTEESVWGDLWKEAEKAFAEWKTANPEKVLDENPFYMMGEVYGYGVSGGRMFDFGDKQVDYFKEGFKSLINFELKGDANNDYETIFSKYDRLLANELKGLSTMNYLTSHDDGHPFDKMREKPLESATKLLLCPGATQVYYGDETARDLDIPGTVGDATLRSFMNWDELAANTERNGHKIQDVLAHWQKLGQFRAAHPAVGAGRHTMLSETPYIFKREYINNTYKDEVIVGLDMVKGQKEVNVAGVFADGIQLKDFYSGHTVTVKKGKVNLDTAYDILLLGLE